MKNETQLKYIVYCRKSSESEDRQVQSIETQERELLDYAKKNGLNIVCILHESQSAHTPGRPIFDKMKKKINKGEANAILVLFPNRISRNPIDAGEIIYLFDTKKLIEIRTPSRIYNNTSSDKTFLTIELAFSKKDSDDKSEHVKTGLRTRYIKGFPNGVASIGYLNDTTQEKGNRTWKIDKNRFKLVKQLLEKFATGKYSIRQLTRIANQEMGLRTPLRDKQGGKELVVSYVGDTVLKNPIYAGFFFDKDGGRHEAHKGITRMISEDQYWQIQNILGNKGRPRASKNLGTFAYVGNITCGGCGGCVTAEHKYQLICPKCKTKFAYKNRKDCPTCKSLIDEMEDPKYLHYIYYHCGSKDKKISCRKHITEVSVDGYLSEYFKENFNISMRLKDWCIENLRYLDENNEQNNYEIKESLEKQKTKKEAEIKNLTMMKVKGLLDDEEYLENKDSLKSEIRACERELSQFEHLDPERLKDAYKAFNHAVGLEATFKEGTVEEKKTVLLEIGSNLTLKDKILNVINKKLYSSIINGLLKAKAKNPMFEPENIVDTSSRNEVFADVCPTLLRG